MSLTENKYDSPEYRIEALKKLLREGEASTQEELCKALHKLKFSVTQSTISRDLRRIGAIKTTDSSGEIFYSMPETNTTLPLNVSETLGRMVMNISSNESMIIMNTTPGSANLVARHLDSLKEELGILGTIAGDDTIFIAPAKIKNINNLIKDIKEEF